MQDDAVIGRTVRDYTESKRKVACVERQLADIGEGLVQIGTRMKECPGRVIVSGEGVVYTAENPVVGDPDYDTKKLVTNQDLSVEFWATLLSDLKTWKNKRRELGGHLRAMGLADLVVPTD